MNCWGMNSIGFSDFHKLLFDYCDRLIDSGEKVARDTWGAKKGFFFPHATDVWG